MDAKGKEITLKPCPFCGRQVEFRLWKFDQEFYLIKCKHCNIGTSWIGSEKAIRKIWNRRTK